MNLTEVAEARLLDTGVNFKYLVFQLQCRGVSRRILRGLNYLPYEGSFEKRLIQTVEKELRELGFFEAGGEYKVLGGGSISVNPYYETVTLYGANPVYGAEESRDESALMVGRLYPTHQVSFFSPELSKGKAK